MSVEALLVFSSPANQELLSSLIGFIIFLLPDGGGPIQVVKIQSNLKL